MFETIGPANVGFPPGEDLGLLFLSALVKLDIDSLSSSSSPEHLFISGGTELSLSLVYSVSLLSVRVPSNLVVQFGLAVGFGS